MENGICAFRHAQFGKIRTKLMPDGQVGFMGKDVAEVLEYSNTRDALRKHVDEEDKIDGVAICDAIGREQRVTFINESGLYSLILSSKMPKAREFKHWVTSEVLPQIRQTGGYGTGVNVDAMSAGQMMALLQSPDSIKMLCKTLVELDEKVQLLGPKAEFANAVMESNDTCTVAELAKLLYDQGIEIGQNRLFGWLRDHHYLGASDHHWNVPQQRWVEAGLFKVKTSEPWYDEYGNSHYNITPLVTGKGQEYFVRGFVEKRFCI